MLLNLLVVLKTQNMEWRKASDLLGELLFERLIHGIESGSSARSPETIAVAKGHPQWIKNRLHHFDLRQIGARLLAMAKLK